MGSAAGKQNLSSPERAMESHCAHSAQIYLRNDQSEVRNKALENLQLKWSCFSHMIGIH